MGRTERPPLRLRELLNDLEMMTRILLIIMVCMAANAYAQRPARPPKADSTVRLAFTSRYTGKEVRLRWAPAKPGAWTLLNRTGYLLERFERDSTGQRVRVVRLSAQPLKPEPLDNWKRFVTPVNQNALIAAQAIYGKKFEMTGNTGGLLTKADELTNRYSFTLLASDLSFETAQAAGLGFIDQAAEPNKRYYYRLYAAQPLFNYLPVDTASVTVDTRTAVVLPQPFLGKPVEEEKKVNLQWPKDPHRLLFTAYHVERSADGKTYKRLNEQPYINMESDVQNKENFAYTDSLSANYRPFYYRLVGITSFGEESQPSEPVRAMGRDRTPPQSPVRVKATHLGGSRVEIQWEATPTGDLAGFYIGRGTGPLSDFKPLFDKTLPPTTRRFVDENASTDTTNYYVVAAADTSGNAASSLSAYCVIVDTIPPAKPTDLVAKIDTNGHVVLQWKKNPERDVKGYLIFKANQRNHVFTAAVKRPLAGTIFRDTLQLRTLTETIYYQVKAVDQKDNTSAASKILELKKPDIVAPTPPVFKDYKVNASGVALRWAFSSSTDVVRHRLYRRKIGEARYKELAQFPNTAQPTYTDSMVQSKEWYEYTLQAEDDAGLKSPMSTALPVKIPDFKGKTGLLSFQAQYNPTQKVVDLNWRNPPAAISIVIYRAENGSGFQTIATVSKGSLQYKDKQVKAAITYQYTARVYYADGKLSPFGPIVNLSF